MRNRKHSAFAKTNPSRNSTEAHPRGQSGKRGKLEFHPGLKSAQTVREILTRNSMTLSQVSKESRKLFPGQSLYHIPHNLYFDLRDDRFTPNIYQLIALSCVSGYSLIHWLSVFGFHLDDISRLQLRLSFPQTMLLDRALYDSHALVEWFEAKAEPPQRITPLFQILTQNVTERVAALEQINRASFLYAKVGTEDDFCFPELLPDSIVRVDPRASEARLAAMRGKVSHDLFLVEHAGGLNCCRLQQLAPRRVALVSTKVTAPRVELQIGTELKILGTIDMEIRSLKKKSMASGFRALPAQRSRELLQTDVADTDLRHLLRKSRQRAGLSFRQASAMSRKLAQELGDEKYSIAIGSLSDYESAEAPPRHIHKVVTLCTLYSIGFWHFLEASGLAIHKLGQRAIPDDLTESGHRAARSRRKDRTSKGSKGDSFLSVVVDRFEEIPLFLHNALAELCGMSRPALRDVFWVGEQEFRAPLRGAAFLVVNQRMKTPFVRKSEPEWKQPVYLLARRDGSYFCGRFALAGNAKVLHPLSARSPAPRPHENEGDAEIVGQVVTVLRWIAARS
jgi:hypothetical protein